jgi:hypothetical protein
VASLIGIVTAMLLLTTPLAHAQAETVIASDNFNRPNESPFAVNGNWGRTIAGNYDGFSNLTSNRVTSASKEGIYYWKGAGVFNPARQFARQRVVQKNGELGLVLLGGADQSIMVAWGPPGVGDTVYIYWYSGGVDRGQLATGPSTVANGDIIEAVLDGGIIYAKVNGVTVRSVANTTTLTSGKPGFVTYLDTSLPGQVSILDDWEAGTPASYTIGGTITENAAGLSGVLVTASGGFSGSATTGGTGAYTITGVPAGATSIVLTPTLSGHIMSPSTRTVAGPVTGNVSGQNFTSSPNSGATLTVQASHGSVTKNPDQATYTLGSVVTLTPFPDDGYDFVSWSGDVPAGHETDDPLLITMNQDRTVAAHFTAPNVVASDDFNRANESPLLVGGNWGRTIAGNYDGFSNLTGNRVTSASKEGIYYWKGAGTFNPASQFARQRVVQKDGELGLVLLGGPDHSIMVAWGPPGVGDTVYIYWYSGGVDRGQLATGPSTLVNGDIIEAVLDGGIIYAKVNGVTVKSVANTTTLTTGTPGFVTYLDTSLPSQVSILDDWEGGTPQSYSISGTVTENAAGLSGVQVTASGGFSGAATTNGSGVYAIAGVPLNATSIVLTPTRPGHTMSPLTRTVAGPVTGHVTGQDFTSTQNTTATLTVLATHGTVTKNPNQQVYAFGTQVTLTPIPDGGYVFSSWSGDVPAGHALDNPLQVTMDQDRTITAGFVVPGAVTADYFDRADETPLIEGGNWQRAFIGGLADLVGNHMIGSLGEAVYYWSGAGTFDNTRQFARARVVQAGGQVGLVLLGADNQALVVSWGAGRLYIYWYLNATHHGELANESSTLSNGDVIEAVLDQGTVYAKLNGVVVKSVPNTTSLSSGRPGFEMYLDGAGFDDWEGGIPPVSCLGAPNGTPCNDGNACTASDACGGGSCQGIAVPPPAEIQGVAINNQTSTALTWGGVSAATYDIASATLSALAANGTTTAACLSGGLPSPSFVDDRPNPAQGVGFYYIVRAKSSCGAGTYGYGAAGVERVPTAPCP